MPRSRRTGALLLAAMAVVIGGCDPDEPTRGSIHPSMYAIQPLLGFGSEQSTTYHGYTFESYGYALSPMGQVVGAAEREAPRQSLTPALWQNSLPRALYPPGMCQVGVACDGAAYAINSRGEVVGRSNGFDVYGWYWREGEFRRLPTLGGRSGIAMDINELGEIAGWSDAPSGFERAVLWQGETAVDLGTLGGLQSQAYGINDSTHVVGWARGPRLSARRAFLWRNGQMVDLGSMGMEESVAHAINSRGQIVGWAGTGGKQHAFVWERGQMRLLDPASAVDGPEAESSVANEINARGDVVGYVVAPSSGRRTAVLWRDGKRYDLNDQITHRIAALMEAHDVNDAGQIVAVGIRRGDTRANAFLLTPISSK